MTELYLPMLDKTVLIAVDDQLVQSVAAHRVEVVGTRNYLVVITDHYASRAAPGEACAEGEEVYVRVLEPLSGEEKWRMLARSCLTGVAAADPIVTVGDDGDGFTVNLTSHAPVMVSLADIEAGR